MLKAFEFEAILGKSQRAKLIVAGMAGLVEDEGYSPHEVMDILDGAKQATFFALAEMHREKKRTD